MSMFDQAAGLLQKLAGGSTEQAVHQQFDAMAQSAPSSQLAEGLASALGSAGSGGFAQMASQLFANGNGQQQASMLNTLMATAGPALLSQFTGGVSALSSLLQSGQPVSAEQAATVSPDEVAALAQHVHQNNPTVVDKLGAVYAEHPTLIKALGAVALGLVMKKVSERNA